jgi:chemotaxis protein MotB
MNKTIVWVVPVVLIILLVGYFITEDRYKKLEEEYNACQGKITQAEKEKSDLLAREQQTKVTYDQLMSQLQKEVGEGQVAIQQYQDKLTVNVAEKIFFDSGKADLKPGGKELLKKFGRIVKGLTDKWVRVEGHTDNVPIAKPLQATYPTNWELSAARAITVVRFLQEQGGVPPKMLMAAAFGQYQPIAPNDTPENKQKNRRIEIVLQNKDVLKRTEAPIAPTPEGTPTKNEVPSAPVPKGTPDKKEAPTPTGVPAQ